MPYCDSPFDDYKVGETVYMDILNRATDYVHIMTPYLILDGELEAALKYAALRGVDVRLILPGIPDKKIAYSLAKTHYRQLITAGVKIYEACADGLFFNQMTFEAHSLNRFWQKTLKKGMTLAIIPTIVFLVSALLLRHWLLAFSALLFGFAHIRITYLTHQKYQV